MPPCGGAAGSRRMTFKMDTPEGPATPDALLALRGQEGFSEAALRRALELALEPPDRPAWRDFLDRTLLVLGALLVAAGVGFFFAFNWQALGHLAKLGLVEAAVVAAALGAWKLDPEKTVGSVLLVVAALLVGPTLGVYGQIYQTGADSYELFLAWTLLILPWVAAGRNGAMALLVVALVNVTANLAYGQLLDRYTWGYTNFHLILFAVDAALWLVWELLRRRQPGPSWVTRVLVALCLLHLTIPSIVAVVDEPTGWQGAALALLAATLVALFTLVRRWDRDLFLPALGCASAISVLTTVSIRLLVMESDSSEFGLLLVGLFILVQVTAAAAWLRRAA